MRKVQLPDQKSGIGPGAMRGGCALIARSHSARQPPGSSGGGHCGSISYHRPVCREARDAEMAPATLPDGGAAVRHRQYVIVRCGAASQETRSDRRVGAQSSSPCDTVTAASAATSAQDDTPCNSAQQ